MAKEFLFDKEENMRFIIFKRFYNYSQNTSSAESVFKKSTEINSVNFS